MYQLVREENIQYKWNGKKHFISVRLFLDDKETEELYRIDVDGIPWCMSDNKMHAIVVFEMIREHLLEYVHYQPLNPNEEDEE